MCPKNCFGRRGPMGPYSQTFCGAPFELTKCAFLTMKQLSWTLNSGKKMPHLGFNVNLQLN
jgi:hypothetical protein